MTLSETHEFVGGYPVHPVANIFPAMSADEFENLCVDIRDNGLHEAVWLDVEGRLLDGRHRVMACEREGVNVKTREYDGHDPAAFVVSLNLHRRHLNEGQRSDVAGRLATMERGARTDLGSIDAMSDAKAAKLLNVSEKSVERAKVVHRTGTPSLQEALTSGKVSVSAAADIATLPQAKQEEIVARGEAEILKAAKDIRADRAKTKRVERVEKIRSMLWPTGVYRVIYADPPWQYSNSGNQDSYGHAERHYQTMSIDSMCALKVGDLAAKDSVLFMWVTSPMLRDAMSLLDAWGFDYKTSFVWDKETHNWGFYNSVRHELLLLATKGSCVPDIDERIPSVVRVDRTDKHSEKPQEFREIINKLYPHGPRIELFARESVQGWEAWGNELLAG